MIPGTLQYPILKLPTDQYGLLYRPSFEIEEWNSMDHVGDWPSPLPPQHFSELERDVLREALSRLKTPPTLIVEIGVDSIPNWDGGTSTNVILKWKPKDCVYIGIDVLDSSRLNDSEKNIYTLQNRSEEHHHLYNLMDELNLNEIDFMFVDGEHSINEVFEEWKYWEKMKADGVMAFHDTNFHPGPIAILAAADPTIFNIEYRGRETGMVWGIGIVERINYESV